MSGWRGFRFLAVVGLAAGVYGCVSPGASAGPSTSGIRPTGAGRAGALEQCAGKLVGRTELHSRLREDSLRGQRLGAEHRWRQRQGCLVRRSLRVGCGTPGRDPVRCPGLLVKRQDRVGAGDFRTTGLRGLEGGAGTGLPGLHSSPRDRREVDDREVRHERRLGPGARLGVQPEGHGRQARPDRGCRIGHTACPADPRLAEPAGVGSVGRARRPVGDDRRDRPRSDGHVRGRSRRRRQALWRGLHSRSGRVGHRSSRRRLRARQSDCRSHAPPWASRGRLRSP